MNQGKHLTLQDRQNIELMLNARKSFVEIAQTIGKHKSTISREVQAHVEYFRVGGQGFNYPECRDQHRANQVSWERLTESAGEGNDDLAREDPEMRQVEIRADLEAVCREIDRKNPLYTQAIRLKELYRMSIDEIAERMNTSRRNVYFYISEAKKIGKEYKGKTEK